MSRIVKKYFASLFAFAIALSASLASAQTFTILHSFSNASDGNTPRAGLVADAAGNLYGTTSKGGMMTACFQSGCGTAFKIDPSGNYTVLHTFTDKPDAADAQGKLTQVSTGTFVGTSLVGGSQGAGSIYRVDTLGSEAVLHSFSGRDGENPEAPLTRDVHGVFYGTAAGGGTGCAGGCGVVFKVLGSGVFSVLHPFAGGTDGLQPETGVAVDTGGNIYGATTTGGTGPCTFAGPGCGIVYKIDPSGSETILHTFVDTDGASPLGTPALDSAGSLYGTTFTRGQFGFGEVYKIAAGGKFSVLYSFTGGTDGSQPMAGVVLDAAGNLYGTTTAGGDTTHSPFGCGVIYRIDAQGSYRVLYRFDCATASFPTAPLLISNGAIYGTAAGGSNAGAVFKLVP